MKYLIDNNLPPGLAIALHALDPKKRIVEAQRNKFPGYKAPGDVPDTDWLPTLITEGNWVIVTQDHAKTEHELRLWHDQTLTVFFLEKGWEHIPLWEKASKLVKWWPTICDTAEKIEPGGSYWIPAKSWVLRRK